MKNTILLFCIFSLVNMVVPHVGWSQSTSKQIAPLYPVQQVQQGSLGAMWEGFTFGVSTLSDIRAVFGEPDKTVTETKGRLKRVTYEGDARPSFRYGIASFTFWENRLSLVWIGMRQEDVSKCAVNKPFLRDYRSLYGSPIGSKIQEMRGNVKTETFKVEPRLLLRVTTMDCISRADSAKSRVPVIVEWAYVHEDGKIYQ